jgi:hypothetical protein
MVGNVARTPRPRTGLQATLEVRWNEARERVLREIPAGHPYRQAANLMKGEIEIDQMEDAVARYHRENAPPTPDPYVKHFTNKVTELRQVYHRTWMVVRAAQQQLTRTADGWRHQLLNDIPQNGLAAPEEASSDYLEFRSADDAKVAEAAWQQKALNLEALHSGLRAALEFDSSPRDVQNSLLLEALFKRVLALEQQSVIPLQRRTRK